MVKIMLFLIAGGLLIGAQASFAMAPAAKRIDRYRYRTAIGVGIGSVVLALVPIYMLAV